ncbi:ATP-binding protein [Peribacillus glennii]|uniref:histidine kinase n=1 Tax=Peribacillus glennii TaxID=2303991 RepID=A0A372L7E0_9BACI|nr:sensor histidine kinase [Peribacillus glennii]RFU61141.1 two-component sensor histidine kinase [Peribacillus glennii]
MDFITKDLLVNFLFILLPLFLVQMFYLLKYTYRSEKLKEGIFVVFPFATIILCMLFPVAVGGGFSWDLRRIPFILGILYGGYRLGFLLLFMILAIRYMIGGTGFYLTLISFTILAVVTSILSKPYQKMSIKNKVIVSCSLSFSTLLITFITSELLFHTNHGIGMWLQYIVINTICMLLTTLFWEVIKANFEVLQKLIKAEKLEVVSHLAASISHEVRNPLTVSRGFIQMLSGDIPPQTRKKYVDIALEELDRATEVINDYLTFAKPVPDQKELIHLPEQILHAIKVITPLANMNGVEVKHVIELEDEEFFVNGERKKFQQCLINLMKNGIESMTDNGQLQIRLTNTNTTIQIDIQDEGSGMTQEQITRLGEPYFTTKAKGTGLGMMVSFSIIKAMGGSINVSSELGKGTSFSIILPIVQTQRDQRKVSG